jgi:hypothetical protein
MNRKLTVTLHRLVIRQSELRSHEHILDLFVVKRSNRA